MKVLNLYAGIGGNRKLWGEDVEVTAVEMNPKIAAIYQEFFPNDKVVVGDAHQYLLENFQNFDFIWSSPPCPSHSKFRFMTTKMKQEGKSRPIIYPDMKLYEEIIILKHYHEGDWAVENVKSYYEPLIKPQESGRHYFWANFKIKNIQISKLDIKYGKTGGEGLGFDLTGKNYGDKRKLLRNCVDPKLGLHIFDESKRDIQGELFK